MPARCSSQARDNPMLKFRTALENIGQARGVLPSPNLMGGLNFPCFWLNNGNAENSIFPTSKKQKKPKTPINKTQKQQQQQIQLCRMSLSVAPKAIIGTHSSAQAGSDQEELLLQCWRTCRKSLPGFGGLGDISSFPCAIDLMGFRLAAAIPAPGLCADPIPPLHAKDPAGM